MFSNAAAPEVRHLRRSDTSGLAEDFDLPGDRYGFGVSWDAPDGRPRQDIDLQCVVVDQAGVIIDCAYYNNLKAVRAITHSGDEATGSKTGIDELVWVHVPRLPENVAVLIFVVAAYSGGSLQDVVNGTLHVLQSTKTNEIARFAMERSSGCVDVVAAMFRSSPTTWAMRIIDEPAREGQHFMDILPVISEVVRVFIPTAPKRQKVAFAMEKGSVMDFPQTLDGISVGLGWDLGSSDIDLDVSAVLLDKSGQEVETVFFGNLESDEHGIKHSGDNLTGEGDGDDEQIMVSLSSIGAAVHQVVFVINIYTPKMTFQNVANPYCRVVDNASCSELCRYGLREAGNESGLIVSKIAREEGSRFGFHALGLACKGRNYKDSLPQIKQMCVEDTRKLRRASLTVDSFAYPPAASHAPSSCGGGPPGASHYSDCGASGGFTSGGPPRTSHYADSGAGGGFAGGYADPTAPSLATFSVAHAAPTYAPPGASAMPHDHGFGAPVAPAPKRPSVARPPPRQEDKGCEVM